MARVVLRDDQFERIAAWLPGNVGDPGRTAVDNRLFVEAVLWIARTGSPWRDLPPEFGPWNAVYQRFARWSRRGVWHRVFAHMAQVCIPRKLDTDSTPNWTVIPRQTGQSERSDAGWMGCTPGRLRGSSC